jgi:DNA polymerase III epsilon subunit-like protein
MDSPSQPSLGTVDAAAKVGDSEIRFETGLTAGQAGGAVVAYIGDTVLHVTTTASARPKEHLDFFPLTVDYEERMYAAGKIPGGFIKRESRPSEAAILAMRLTDRPIRPLFPKGYRNDVQVVLTVLSTDQENDPDILAINGASAALSISHIPFLGPIGAVRVGYLDGQFITNPTITQLDESQLDLVVAGTRDAVMMVEAGATILPESVMADAIEYGLSELQKSIDLQEKLVATVGVPKKMPFVAPRADSVVKLGASLAEGSPEFVVLDLETTAFKPENGFIVDVAAVKVRDGQVIDRFESLVNPGRSIVGHQVHGIRDEDVASAPTAAEVLPRFVEWVGGAALVAHNIGFDLPFIQRHLPPEVRWEPKAVYDTLELGYQIHPDAGGHKKSSPELAVDDRAVASGLRLLGEHDPEQYQDCHSPDVDQDLERGERRRVEHHEVSCYPEERPRHEQRRVHHVAANHHAERRDERHPGEEEECDYQAASSFSVTGRSTVLGAFLAVALFFFLTAGLGSTVGSTGRSPNCLASSSRLYAWASNSSVW